ncbi:MAG: isoamylase early set domain-containing protein [Planctomycetota bacterium]|mgnify:CR=1 FL=1
MPQDVLVRRPQAAPMRRVSLVARIPDAKEVVVTGDFTKWTLGGIQMVKAPNGEWRTGLDLPAGEYQYRLRVDGAWRDHAEAAKRVPNPFGCENCVLVVK